MSDSGPGLWSVRGVSEDVRRMAFDKAKAAGVPIGQWVSHAIRQTPALDSDAPSGEVVSDGRSDGRSDKDPLAMVEALSRALGQISAIKGNGRTAERMRWVLDQYLAELAPAPLPPRLAVKQIASDAV